MAAFSEAFAARAAAAVRRQFHPGVMLLSLIGGLALQAQPEVKDPGDSGFPTLQRRVIEIYEDTSAAVVRVKAAFNEPAAEGEDSGRPRVSLKVGTGFFVSRDGHVVTNASIAGGADRVWVETQEAAHAAEVLAADPDSNFALLRLATPPRNPVILPLESTDTPRTGTFVVAVTAPLDLGPTPSFGLIAGQDRGFAERTFPIRFIRVSVPANPGEGGSPVLDLSGRVIGMMIASVPELRASYVLPVRALQRLRDDVIFHGGVRPGWVGLDLEEQVGTRSVLVKEVLPGTPAAAAGLAAGDLLLQMDGQPVKGLDEFRESSFYARIGQLVSLRIRRGTEVKDLVVTVAAKPPPAAVVEQTERESPPLEEEPKSRHPSK